MAGFLRCRIVNVVRSACLVLTASVIVLGGVLGAVGTASANDAAQSAEPVEPVRPARFEDLLAELAAGEDIVGLAAAAVRDGEIRFLRTFGVRDLDTRDLNKQDVNTPDVNTPDLETRNRVTPDTVFRIASLSKGFAGTLAAQLVTEGKLALETPAAPFAPAFQIKNQAQLPRVTLENVLTHRLGLPPYAFDNLLEADVEPDTILRRLGTVDPICSVGRCYAYQNVAFNIAAHAIEAADGRSYAAALRSRLFAPLTMETASIGADGLKATGNWARSHRRRKGEPWISEGVDEAYYRLPAAAGVNASVRDMARWLIAQMGHAPDVVSPAVLDLIHTPRVATPGEAYRIRKALTVDGAHYALGWRVYDYRGETVVNHAGSVQGYSAQIAFLPGRDAGLVVLTNSRSKAFREILPAWLEAELEHHPGRP